MKRVVTTRVHHQLVCGETTDFCFTANTLPQKVEYLCLAGACRMPWLKRR
jgi:hypothetical protein